MRKTFKTFTLLPLLNAAAEKETGQHYYHHLCMCVRGYPSRYSL